MKHSCLKVIVALMEGVAALSSCAAWAQSPGAYASVLDQSQINARTDAIVAWWIFALAVFGASFGIISLILVVLGRKSAQMAEVAPSAGVEAAYYPTPQPLSIRMTALQRFYVIQEAFAQGDVRTLRSLLGPGMDEELARVSAMVNRGPCTAAHAKVTVIAEDGGDAMVRYDYFDMSDMSRHHEVWRYRNQGHGWRLVGVEPVPAEYVPQ